MCTLAEFIFEKSEMYSYNKSTYVCDIKCLNTSFIRNTI